MKKYLLTLLMAFAAISNANATDATSVSAAKDDAKKNEVNSYEEFIKQVKEFEASDKFKPALLNTSQAHELNVGDSKAPVHMVEYASLGCIHCKQFHQDVFYQLKKNYIDTGKVYYTYRHYPLNAPAVKAAVIMSCIAPEDKLAFMGTLFEAQAQWAYSKSEPDLVDKLKTVSKIAGMTNERFEGCYKDEKVQNEILANMKQAYEDLFVTSTPSIFINGKRFLESREYEGTAKYIDGLLEGKSVEDVRKQAEAADKAQDEAAAKAEAAKTATTPAAN